MEHHKRVGINTPIRNEVPSCFWAMIEMWSLYNGSLVWPGSNPGFPHAVYKSNSLLSSYPAIPRDTNMLWQYKYDMALASFC